MEPAWVWALYTDAHGIRQEICLCMSHLQKFIGILCSFDMCYPVGTIFKRFEDKEAALRFGEYGENHDGVHIVSIALIFFVLAQLFSFIINNFWIAGLSISILEAGYGMDCLMAQYQGLDLRLSENWQGPAGLRRAATRNQVDATSIFDNT